MGVWEKYASGMEEEWERYGKYIGEALEKYGRYGRNTVGNGRNMGEVRE